MLRGLMKCCPFSVGIIHLKGHSIPYLVWDVWYLVRNIWLPSRCTSHSLSAPYLELGLSISLNIWLSGRFKMIWHFQDLVYLNWSFIK